MSQLVRCIVVGIAAAAMLGVSPVARGDDTGTVVTLDLASPAFLVETLGGIATGTVSYPDGVRPIAYLEAPAANGSIAFIANDNADPASGDQGSLWLVAPNQPPVHLDASPWDFDPTITYDGSKIGFARLDPVTKASDIYVVNADGSGLTLVASGKGSDFLRLPRFSPDGGSIAYWCGPANNSDATDCGPLLDGTTRSSGVMLMNADGSDKRMIIIGAGNVLEPVGPSGLSWAPNAQWLALDGLLTVDLGNNTVTSIRQLFAYHTDGSDLFNNADPTRQVGDLPPSLPPNFPEFTSDGSQILYMSFVDDTGAQGNFPYLIGADGTNNHQIVLSSEGLPFGEVVPPAVGAAPPPTVNATRVTVPPVDALSYGAAQARLAAAHLTVGAISYEYSATVGKNLVASQYPSAGAVAHRTTKQGPPVNLVLSRGPVVCVVPRVKGRSLKVARRAMTAAHCAVGRITRAFSRSVEKGRVVLEKPSPGRKLHNGARVALTVSKGKKPVR